MKVGVFTVGLPDLTPEEAVREIKDAGYDGVEWRVTRVPEELRGEAPSFWGNNLCTLAPSKEEARRGRRLRLRQCSGDAQKSVCLRESHCRFVAHFRTGETRRLPSREPSRSRLRLRGPRQGGS